MESHANADASWSSSSKQGEEIDPVLRAKYLDYCSARICEIFLSLSDNRIFDLMEEAAREAGLEPGSLGSRQMVRLVTRKLRRSVPLPTLEEWAEDYRAHPERYDPFLLGLWESAVSDDAETEGGDSAR